MKHLSLGWGSPKRGTSNRVRASWRAACERDRSRRSRYFLALMPPGERKSVEPTAAPERTAAQHQPLLHLCCICWVRRLVRRCGAWQGALPNLGNSLNDAWVFRVLDGSLINAANSCWRRQRISNGPPPGRPPSHLPRRQSLRHAGRCRRPGLRAIHPVSGWNRRP